jgi:hypothetical protein
MIRLSELSNTNTLETYTITAIIDSALCVGAGGSSGSLADKPIIRNSEGNLPEGVTKKLQSRLDKRHST